MRGIKKVEKGTEHSGILPHTVFLLSNFLLNLIGVRFATIKAESFW